MLLSHGAAEDARDKNWQTPAHVAAANNAVSCMRLLIPAMSNVNITDRMGRDDIQPCFLCVVMTRKEGVAELYVFLPESKLKKANGDGLNDARAEPASTSRPTSPITRSVIEHCCETIGANSANAF